MKATALTAAEAEASALEGEKKILEAKAEIAAKAREASAAEARRRVERARAAAADEAKAAADFESRMRCVLHTGPHTTAFAW